MKLQKKLLSAALLLAVHGAWAAPLEIRSQGVFAAGGSVTAPVPGTYNPTTNWLDKTRAGNTAHIDHASVLFHNTAWNRSERDSGWRIRTTPC